MDEPATLPAQEVAAAAAPPARGGLPAGPLLLALAATAAALGSALLPRARIEWLYAYATYWVMAAVTGIGAALLVRQASSEGWFAGGLKPWRAPLGCAALAAAVLVVSVPPRLRVLSDETNVLGVAQAMTVERSAYNPTIAKRYYGMLHIQNREIEKRPMLVPFWIHLVHLVTGTRWQNGFVLNLTLLFLFLAGLYAAVERRGGHWPAASAVALAAFYPLAALCFTSAGIEAAQTAVLAAALAALGAFLREPGPGRLALLWAAAVALCHTRYEGALLSGVILACLLASRRASLEHAKPHAALFALTPLLLSPLVWQRLLTRGLWENPAGTDVFSAAYFLKFSRELLAAHATPWDRYVPHAIMLNWVSAAMAAALAWWWLRGEIRLSERPLRWWLAAAAGSVGAHTLLVLSFWYGDYVHPASARYFLPLSVAGALVPVAFHLARPDLLSGRALAGLAAASVFVYHPISAGAWHTNALEQVRQTKAAMDFVQRRADENALILYSAPGRLTALGRGAMNFPWANRVRASLTYEYERGLYSGIFALQRVDLRTGRVNPEDLLDPVFELEPVEELQVMADEMLRASWVVRPRGLFSGPQPSPASSLAPAGRSGPKRPARSAASR